MPSQADVGQLFARRGIQVVAYIYTPFNGNMTIRVFKDGPRRDFKLPKNHSAMSAADFDDQVVASIDRELSA